MEGKKFDTGKPRMGLIPREAKLLIAKVLTFGAEKYDAWNWAKGMKWSRLIDATQRHLDAWAEGENIDEETGLSHLGGALCSLVFLAVYEARGLGEDDRHKWNEEEVARTVEVINAPLMRAYDPHNEDKRSLIRCEVCKWESPYRQSLDHPPHCRECGRDGVWAPVEEKPTHHEGMPIFDITKGEPGEGTVDYKCRGCGAEGDDFTTQGAPVCNCSEINYCYGTGDGIWAHEIENQESV